MHKIGPLLAYCFIKVMKPLIWIVIPFATGVGFEHYRTKEDPGCPHETRTEEKVSNLSPALEQENERAQSIVKLIEMHSALSDRRYVAQSTPYQRPYGQRIDQVQPLNEVPRSRMDPPQDAFSLMREEGQNADRLNAQKAVRPNDMSNQLRNIQNDYLINATSEEASRSVPAPYVRPDVSSDVRSDFSSAPMTVQTESNPLQNNVRKESENDATELTLAQQEAIAKAIRESLLSPASNPQGPVIQ